MFLVGYAFADQFETLLGYFEKPSWIIAAGLFAVAFFLWRREKKRIKQRQHQQQQAAQRASRSCRG